jgi:demethylmenaquinone methyltransferase / 2-methoxy-6-polyprenyl-1,4-benzoquinol methylase
MALPRSKPKTGYRVGLCRRALLLIGMKQALAWTQSELTDPHRHAEKAAKVRGMFSAIAGSYDLNNRVHSLWRDQAWRRYAVRAAGVRPGDQVLDVACGTGDLTELFAKSPAAKVVGGDFTPAMLDVARAKQPVNLSAEQAAKVSYVDADAMGLAFPDASFDVVSIAFGIRNVTVPAKAVAEFARVLKPGGRLVILEFERPRFAPVRWFNDFYCGWIMPRTATLLSGDRSGAYKYLPKSVGTFMSREQLSDVMRASGFKDVTSKGLTLGICVCYRGVRTG